MKMKLMISAMAVLAMSLPASALTAKQNVYKEVATPSEAGPPVLTRAPADLVAPGDTVIYALEFTNDKTEAVSNIVLTMPIPEEVNYIQDSATQSGVSVIYSANNGTTFGAWDDLTVDDGGVARPARAEDITHIRWTVTEDIAPGASGELVFKGKLK